MNWPKDVKWRKFCEKKRNKLALLRFVVHTQRAALPKLSIEVTPKKDLNKGKIGSIKTKIETNDNLKLVGDLVVSYNTHLGWDVGPQTSVSVKDQLDEKVITSEEFFNIPDNCWVVNASAVIWVEYGNFKFKIHDQKIIFRGDWANEVGRK